MKKAFLLCSSHNDLGLITALRKLGYEILVSGNRPGLPGEHWADRYIPADYSDKEAILEIARREKVDAICACCNDFGVYTAAYVAEKLGLPGYDSYETTLLLHNKDRFKRFAAEIGLPSPQSQMFSSPEEAEAYLESAAYPVIVKPTDASAGNGISRADDRAQALEAVARAFGKSRAGRIVIEPFITGSQHGFCTFLKDRKVIAVCSNNEYSIENPYRVEIDTFPADNFDKVADELIASIEKIAEKLQLCDGIFHLQYLMDGDRPKIIEVMRRILGNMYHVPGNMLTALDWEYWQIRVQCGLPIDCFPLPVRQEGCFAYKTILAPGNGRIGSVKVPEEYSRYLLRTYMVKKPGEGIANWKSEPVGFLFFMFPSQEIMKKMLISDYRNDLVCLQ